MVYGSLRKIYESCSTKERYLMAFGKFPPRLREELTEQEKELLTEMAEKDFDPFCRFEGGDA